MNQAAFDDVDRAIIRYILDHTREHQRPPTLSETAAKVGRSHQAVRQRYQKLAKYGVLKLTARASRGVKVIGNIG